jgi:outer membrane protein assembly factor BamE
MFFSHKISVWLLLGAISLTGCARYDQATREIVSNITPYRINIIQGQLVTNELLATIQKGMTREQIVEKLGTPSVESVWAPNEMSYVFSYNKGYKTVVENSRVTFIFDNAGLLTDIQSHNLLSEKDIIQKIDQKIN